MDPAFRRVLGGKAFGLSFPKGHFVVRARPPEQIRPAPSHADRLALKLSHVLIMVLGMQT